MSQQQRILQAAMRYASLGWKLVPLYGVQAGGVCDCRKGADCSSAGKHPRLNDWGIHATSDEDVIAGWADLWPRFNVGLLLGRQSGIVDIEFDGIEGRATADRLLANAVTPSYRSSRSDHRLFRWRPDLPLKSIRKVFGLECRIGNETGTKAIQSVLPPSQHGSGTLYEWMTGMSPEEVEVADLPEDIYAMLVNLDETDTQGTLTQATRESSSGAGRAIMRPGGIPEGGGDGIVSGRNDALYRFACREARRAISLDAQYELDDLEFKVVAMNHMQCRPPLNDAEVRTIIASAIQFVRTTPTEREQQAAVQLEFYGLQRGGEEWWPGSWRVAVRNSDPWTCRLKVPSWGEMTSGRGVVLTADEYYNAHKVAIAVLNATGSVILENTPKFWSRVWSGEDGKRPKIGLHKKLMESAERESEEVAPIESLTIEIAEYVVHRISVARQGTEVDPNGQPTRLPDETIVFKWERLFEEAFMRRLFTPRESRRWRDALSVGTFRQISVSGRRPQFCIFTTADIDKLNLILRRGNDV